MQAFYANRVTLEYFIAAPVLCVPRSSDEDEDGGGLAECATSAAGFNISIVLIRDHTWDSE